MDDSCAVCAENLEWAAYGACGHKDVCSTCVVRLRFICDDRRCCICKTESDVVFVSKALGDYTKTISDFSLLHSEAKEGKVGQYWYHEDTQAYFDDLDHYKMIKAMCRLSCNVCDRLDDQPEDGPRRRAKFKNVDQLKGHLFHKHKLLMCSLCLEGRKVFICEQKFYTRSQLTQHISTGDSEVDGTESERGGFTGHPVCQFCRTPFYGDNELYTHMSTEHYTCHICQRQHPGQYEYYKNYDDLEMHFRGDHFLCEDENCLGKKFIVFPCEAEWKRHNALEHGGQMSRLKRSAALQIPTSFRYRRSSEQDNHRGRGRSFRRDGADTELSLAIQASLETANVAPASSRNRFYLGEMMDAETLIPPLESSSVNSDSEDSRSRQALSQISLSGTLGESSFPPLAVSSGSSQQNSNSDLLQKKTMAAHLRCQSNCKLNASSSATAWPAASRAPVQPAASRAPVQPAASQAPVQPAITHSRGWPSMSSVSGSAASSRQTTQRTEVAPASCNYASSQCRHPPFTDSSFTGYLILSKTSGSFKRMSHSSSAPNLSECGSPASSGSNFPPISATQPRKSPATEEVAVKVKDVHTANKSLVEQMRAALGFDEDKFTDFKEISGEYRVGSMDAETYLAYVEQFGLSHLVLDLARLLPDALKQKELIDAHNFRMRNNISRKNGGSNGIRVNDSNGSKKGKGKAVDSGCSTAKINMADDIISQVKELQSSYRASEEKVEVLSKDGYRADRGKSVVADVSQVELCGPCGSTKSKSKIDSSSAGDGANQNSGTDNGKSKQRKKTSKFHRVRLGEGSVETLLDLKNTDPDRDPGLTSKEAASTNGVGNLTESLSVRGVWRNGGGKKLLSKVPKN